MTDHLYEGECFCGSVKFKVSGEPQGMGYCHCTSCRTWAAAPVNGFTLWKPEDVEITEGAELIAEYQKTENSQRRFCTVCGGHLMTEHPGLGLIDVYSAMVPDLDFQPGVHIHYQEKVLRIPDGLPKFADMPTDFGGSGKELPE